jgi:hypothetical protein
MGAGTTFLRPLGCCFDNPLCYLRPPSCCDLLSTGACENTLPCFVRPPCCSFYPVALCGRTAVVCDGLCAPAPLLLLPSHATASLLLLLPLHPAMRGHRCCLRPAAVCDAPLPLLPCCWPLYCYCGGAGVGRVLSDPKRRKEPTLLDMAIFMAGVVAGQSKERLGRIDLPTVNHSLVLENIMNEITPLHQWHFRTADDTRTPVLSDLIYHQHQAALAAMTTTRDQ